MQTNRPGLKFNAFYLAFAIFGVVMIHNVWTQMTTVETIPYSQFQQLVRENKVAEVAVGSNHITGRLKQADESGKERFVTTRIDPALAVEFRQSDAKVYGLVESTLLRDILSWVLPAVVFVGIWILMMRRFGQKGGLGGGFMAIGKSKAKVYVETDTKVTFADVAGIDEAEDELQEIVSYLKNPAAYGRLGGRMPKGVLLVGPPGTGKTLLAKAVAGEAGVPFFSISGSEFVEMFVGVGAARVRDLFEQARQKAPAIIFIDELDALGKSRQAGPFAGGHDEKEQTLNQLLVELDGFDSSKGLILLAATNRPEILDPALLRAGRFDRQVLVDRPDKKGRIAILDVHLKKVRTLGASVSTEKVAAMTPGFTGADLANLVNEATLIATRRNAEAVELTDFNEAIERIVAGLEKKNRVLSEAERRIVAYHEMGHALVGAALSVSERIHKVSIIPRGIGALGYTIQRPTEDRFLMTKEELERKMAVLLGGRAAERVVFGHLSTGAADDLAKATQIARAMVTRYGMEESLGHVSYDSEGGPGFLGDPSFAPRRYSDDTAREVDKAVQRLVEAAFEQAREVLVGARAVLEESAHALLKQETLDEADLETFFARLTSATHQPQVVRVDA
jgi:cell division protease FtsH